jgi:cation transport ATPase
VAVVTDAASELPSARSLSRRKRYRAALIISVIALLLAAVLSSHPHLERWVAFILILPVALIYLLPSYVAALRGHHKLMAIGALNVLLGWTILGWVAALVWSATRWGHQSREV